MSDSPRLKLAAITTIYFKYSHAQDILDRWLEGYGWNGTYHYPAVDLVSLYVDQVGKDDLSRERASRHPGTGEHLTKERFEELHNSSKGQWVLIFANTQETVDKIIPNPLVRSEERRV